MISREKTTQLLARLSQGDRNPVDELMPHVYDEMRAIASRHLASERAGHTLQPTALVHEAFLKMVNQDAVDWKGKAHFLAVAAKQMRRILVDHAKTKGRQKRGGGRQRISLQEELTISPRDDADVLAVEEALHKLAELNPLQANIVEKRFYGGMTVEEVAEVLGVSKRAVERQWTAIRAWLRRELAAEDEA
jgi:RNA polymerase sigma factor (TIGR02999 family)